MSQPSPQVSPVAAPALPAQPAQASPAAPAEAHHGPSTAAPQQPATAPTNHMPTASTASTLAPAPASQTYFEKLEAGDRDWKWKIGLRTILIIVSFIGLGCAAWVVANFTTSTMYSGWEYDMDDGWSIPWVLVTFVLSIIWSSVCVFVFFKRRSHGPVHPGAQVGVDLILWLGYIVTGMFAILAVSSVKDYGSSGLIGNYSSDGPWTYSQGNNTWVYNGTASYYSSSVRSCDSSSRSYYSSGFSSCAEIDSYINLLWTTKNARFNTEMCATVCQFIALFLHLVLFVWACVDTNRRNSRKVGKDAEKLAADIIQNMIKSGAIIPAPGQAHMKPMPMPMQPFPPQMMHGYPQYGQYPQYPQYPPQHQPQMMQHQPQHFSRPLSSPRTSQGPTGPLPAVPSSSNEKSAGSRFA